MGRKKNAVELNGDAPIQEQRTDAVFGRVENAAALAWAHQSVLDWRRNMPRCVSTMEPDLMDDRELAHIRNSKLAMADEVLSRLLANDWQWFLGVSNFLRHAQPQSDAGIRPVDFERAVIFSLMENAAAKGEPLPTNAEVKDELAARHKAMVAAGYNLEPLVDERQQEKIAKAARDSIRR